MNVSRRVLLSRYGVEAINEQIPDASGGWSDPATSLYIDGVRSFTGCGFNNRDVLDKARDTIKFYEKVGITKGKLEPWNDVRESVPDDMDCVLVAVDELFITIAQFCDGEFVTENITSQLYQVDSLQPLSKIYGEVTHWLPLPSIPSNQD